MVRKKPEEMEFEELKKLAVWYTERLRYIKFLMQDKFGGHA